MTAVTPSREALAKALAGEFRHPIYSHDGTPLGKRGGFLTAWEAEGLADHLIASGAVVPLDTLADDEALAQAVASGFPLDVERHASETIRRAAVADRFTNARKALRALAAALSERGDR
jgi:hypothetical protein